MPVPAARVRAELRRLSGRKAGLLVPGAYDGVSARLVERAGFPAVYMTGYGTAASRLGLPDLGFAGLAEMVENARQMAATVRIPLIADADTGYGGALAVERTIRAYEAAGVAALHIEDQEWPKRCGHLAGKAVIPCEEMVAKITAAVEARTDPNLLVIARTDAIAVTGFEDAIARATAYAKAGADVLFVEAPVSRAQVEAIPRRLSAPCLFNYAPSGRSPLLPVAELGTLGYALILLPVQTLFAATRAMQEYLRALREHGEPAALDHQLISFADFNALIGVADMLEREQRLMGGAPPGG
ncbi:MAG TPA: isocitrate lyase/PEP mutase family protein [Methylomirabilota bacterium]|nr:isocitrate lyase/PEP mutase family protein [Methylomirabilota bacterium]HEV8676864.1 isocitrate lyase/PEP mutase family protein [Methylomirabilota bacterium]